MPKSSIICQEKISGRFFHGSIVDVKKALKKWRKWGIRSVQGDQTKVFVPEGVIMPGEFNEKFHPADKGSLPRH